jgi:predicted metalloenzyme YecM
MKMFDDLMEYPRDIAKLQSRILRLDRRIRKAQKELEQMTADIEIAIANDTDLKNDQQRKAKRLELMRKPEYVSLSDAVVEGLDRKTRFEIQVGLLRNEFSVLKLQFRDHIASKEYMSA